MHITDVLIKIYLAQCSSQVLPNHASPGKNMKKAKHKETALKYSIIRHTMISSEWGSCLLI